MGFFQKMLTALNGAIAALEQPNSTEDDRSYALELADRVFQVSEQMGGGILGDVDDQLLTKAHEIKQKFGS